MPKIARYNVYRKEPNGDMTLGSHCILCARFFPGNRSAIRSHFKNSKMHWIRKKLIPLTKFLK